MSGCSGCSWFEGCRNHGVSFKLAEKEKNKKKFITIRNETDSTINLAEIRINSNKGHCLYSEENPDWYEYTYEIERDLEEYDTYVIVLQDNFDLK